MQSGYLSLDQARSLLPLDASDANVRTPAIAAASAAMPHANCATGHPVWQLLM
jgi:hypothetical protein